MNYIDLFLIAPLIFGAFMGFRKGLILEVASLVALVLGVYGAMKFSFYISFELTKFVDWSPELIHIASLALTFIGIVMTIHLIARAIQRIVKMAALGIANRISGAVFGCVKYLIVLSIVLYGLDTINKKYPFLKKEMKENSIMYGTISSIIPLVYPSLEEYFELQD